MKKILLAAIALAAAVALASENADRPIRISYSVTRGEGGSEAINPDISYFRGNYFTVTNVVLHTGATTNTAAQDLADLTAVVVFRSGALSFAITNVFDSDSRTNFYLPNPIRIPTNWPTMTVQHSLSGGGITYVYPRKRLIIKEKLQ